MTPDTDYAVYADRAEIGLRDIPACRPMDHTMADDLDHYVDQRIPVEPLLDAVADGTSIEVHSIHPDHLDAVAATRGWRGLHRLCACELPGKLLNGSRPQMFTLTDPWGQPRLGIAVPPGRDYLRHYAALVRHVMARRTAHPQMRVWHYPKAERSVATWTGLDETVLGAADTVVFGKIELVAGALAAAGMLRRAQRLTPYFSATEYEAPGRRIVLLGVRFSYWGCIGGRLAVRCCELGAREILYIGKLGTLGRPGDIYSRLFVPSRYAVLDGMQVRAAAPGPANGLLAALPSLDSGLHVSVPTVLEEDHAQRSLAAVLGANTLDNELAQMALAIHAWNIDAGEPVGFSALHYATDYLRRPEESALVVPHSLATGRTPDARLRRARAERMVGACLGRYLAEMPAHKRAEVAA